MNESARPALQNARKEAMRYITLTSLSAVPMPLAASALDRTADPLAGARKDIEAVLRMLAKDVPRLRPARQDLQRITAEAVAALQGDAFRRDAVRKLSVGRMLAKHGDVPRPDGLHAERAVRKLVAEVLERLATPLADSLISGLDRIVIAALGAGANREIGRMVRDAHASRLLSHENDPLDALAHVVWRSYHDVLRLQFGLVAAKRDEYAITGKFIELYAAGNIPVGTLDDGSFLVLVA